MEEKPTNAQVIAILGKTGKLIFPVALHSFLALDIFAVNGI